MTSVVQQALAPFTLKGFYLLTWGTALGTNIFHSISSVKQYTTLDRTNFAKLQAQLQPLYFATSSILTSSLLATHLYFHPVLVSSPLRSPHWYQLEEGVQGLLIAAACIPQLVNWLCIGPQAAKAAVERADVEKAGKAAPDALEKANNKFTSLHGLATALNNTSLLALVGLGLAVSM